MATIKCSKGHLYDSAQGSCPVCAREGSSWNFGGAPDDIPATSPAGNWSNFSDVGETMPGEGFGMPNIGETEPVTNPGFTAGDFFSNPSGSTTKLDDFEPTMAEPINGVDMLTRDWVMDEIAARRDGNRLMLISTHLVEQAEAVADHAAFLHHGELMHVGSMDALCADRSLADLYREIYGEVQPC